MTILNEDKIIYMNVDENADLYTPQGIDLGWGGSSSQHGMTQQEGLSHSADICKVQLIKCNAFLSLHFHFASLLTENEEFADFQAVGTGTTTSAPSGLPSSSSFGDFSSPVEPVGPSVNQTGRFKEYYYSLQVVMWFFLKCTVRMN